MHLSDNGLCIIQADAYAHSKGLQLVGYYQANAHIEDLDLGAAGKKIAERIQSHTHQACAVLVQLFPIPFMHG